jgi:hypothetical protein
VDRESEFVTYLKQRVDLLEAANQQLTEKAEGVALARLARLESEHLALTQQLHQQTHSHGASRLLRPSNQDVLNLHVLKWEHV